MLLRKPKPQYNTVRHYALNPPQKKKCPQYALVFASNDLSDPSVVSIMHDWNSKASVGLSKILGRQDAPCIYAFLDDYTFAYVYDFRVGNSTEPEIVAD